MKIIIYITTFFIVFSSFECFSQKEALIIKHIGYSNHPITPLVFTIGSDDISNGFRSEYLAFNKKLNINYRTILQIKSSKEEFCTLKKIVFNAASKKKDTSTYNKRRLGSFEFVSVSENKLNRKIVINDGALSLEIFNELIRKLPRKQLSNYDLVIDGIIYLIGELEPNSKIEIAEDIIFFGVKSDYKDNDFVNITLVNDNDTTFFILILEKFVVDDDSWEEVVIDVLEPYSQMGKTHKLTKRERKEVKFDLSILKTLKLDFSSDTKYRFVLKYGKDEEHLRRRDEGKSFLINFGSVTK